MKSLIKKRLTEAFNRIITEINLDEDYPSNFDMEKFKSLKRFNDRVAYCDENLKRISGQGSSRIVYKIDNEKVLKLAKNEAGIAQNKTEIKWGKDSNYTSILAHTFDNHPDGFWVEMELAKPINSEIFNSLLGYKLEQLCLFLKWYYFTSKGFDSKAELFNRMLVNADEEENSLTKDDFMRDKFASSLTKFISDIQTGSGDFCMYDTYGVVKRNGRNQVVIIDFGITEEIYRTYYS